MDRRKNKRRGSDIFEEITIDSGQKESGEKRLRAGKNARKPKSESEKNLPEHHETIRPETVKTIEIVPRKPRKHQNSQLPPILDMHDGDKPAVKAYRTENVSEKPLSLPDISRKTDKNRRNEIQIDNSRVNISPINIVRVNNSDTWTAQTEDKRHTKRLTLDERTERRQRAEDAQRRAYEEMLKAEAERKRRAEEERAKKQAARAKLIEEKRLREKIKREEELTARLKELREEKDRELKELERIKREKEELLAENEKTKEEIKKERDKAAALKTGVIDGSTECLNDQKDEAAKKVEAAEENAADDEASDSKALNSDTSGSEEADRKTSGSGASCGEASDNEASGSKASDSCIESGTENSSESRQSLPFYKKKSFVAAAAISAAVFGGYGAGTYYYLNRFLPYTHAEGIDIGGLTPEEAGTKLSTSDIAESLKLIGRDRNEILDLSGANSGITESSLSEAQKKQNHLLWPAALIGKNSEPVGFSVICDEKALDVAIGELGMLDPSNVVPPQDAYAGTDPTTGEFGIIAETEGNEIDGEKLKDAVKEAMSEGKFSLDLDEAGVYIEPGIRSNDEYLTANIDKMERLNETGASVDLGAGVTYDLDGEKLFGLLDSDLHADTGKIRNLVSEFASEYNTVSPDKIRTIIKHNGEEKELQTDYGWMLDEDATYNALCEAINRASATVFADMNADISGIDKAQFAVSAAWKQTAASHGENDYGSTYIEIDMGEQNVYVFKDGECVIETPCVSGKMTADRTTPEGMYSIRYKQTDRVLTGYNRDGSVSYRSPVKYWMPFNKGIGLHDASWRKQFGGDIYKNAGSHGCINLPKDAAGQIYDIVYTGMPVLCYY